jgi:predicted aspartyl protease
MAYIGVSQARHAALIAAGQAIPTPIRIQALVDTGASCSAIDPSVLQQLGLTPTGIVTVNTPSTGNQPHTTQQYDVSIAIPGASATHIPMLAGNVPVVAAQLAAAQGFQALFGRDILANCLLTYNGPMRQFTLAY